MICIDCQLKPSSLDGVYSMFEYDGVGGRLVTSAKYQRQPDWLRLLLKRSPKPLMPFSEQLDVCMPIPDRQKRLRQRGFSTTHMISAYLNDRTAIPIVKDGLKWAKPTRTQQGLSRAERKRNMQGAFEGRGVRDQTVLLVDDVYTTGETLKSASRALKRAGAKKVYAMTLCYRG